MYMANKFFISAGGTGGHILPALAIYYNLISKKETVKFVCREKDLTLINELRKINSDLLFLNAVGFKRKISGRNFIAVYWIVINIIKTLFWFLKYKPDAVIGMGGYITFPVLFWANILKREIFLFEQNSIPGMVNKLFYKKASCVFINFEYTKKFIPDGILVNNPVRLKKIKKNSAYKYFGFVKEYPVILISGGSQGARIINETIKDILPELVKKFNIIWLTGKNNYNAYRKYLKLKNVQIKGFLDEMSYAYSIADLVISRAGSMSLTEIIYFEIPSILIPLKIATGNHQYYNAKSLQQRGAAMIIEEKDLSPDMILKSINSIFHNKSNIGKMKRKLKNLYVKNSDRIIVEEIYRRLNR